LKAVALDSMLVAPAESGNMKTSQKHRPRPTRRNKGSKPSPQRIGWKLIGLIVFGCTIAIGWLALNFAWPSSPDGGRLAAGVSKPAGKSLTNNAALVRTSAPDDESFGRLVNRGNELLAQGKAAEAVETLTEAMQMKPQNEDIHYDLGLALAREGKLEEAIQQYDEALRLFPNYVEAHNNVGNLLLRAGRAEEAIGHFETALKIMPDYASAHNNLGTALQKIGQSDEALLHFQRATNLNPDYWEAHFNVGTTYLKQGRIAEARAELETVRRLQPDFQPAQSALARIEAGETSPVLAPPDSNP
jgi:tetratricopeptide (TPR) repeat protein